jgi:glycerol-3-phosphate acyltransferase PlsY
MWPILFRFKGEHGNTTGFGVAAALAYWALPFALIPVVTGVAIKVIASLRESSKPMSERLQFSGAATWSMPLGMGLGFVAFPLASWGLKLDGWITLACLILLMLIIIKRLTDGLMEDLKIAPDKRSVLLNRLLYDRGYRQN